MVPVPAARSPGIVGLLVSVLVVATLPLATLTAVAAAPDHLLISEVVTGGASASDELIEIYNPTATPLPLEGLELVYVSASGATVSRRAAWALGAPPVEPQAHLLIANEAGVYASIADVTYATGMAATGGSVALRIQGATTAIDAVGWGTATGTWLEGVPAPAPAPGSSIERLPGGALGSTQDTDDNATDFALLTVPDPQNRASLPTPAPGGSPTATPSSTPTAEPTPEPSGTPSATTSPTPDPTPTSTPPPTPTPTSTPTPSGSPSPSPAPVVDVAVARGLPDGTSVTIEGVALTDSAFSDGGGYLADASAGIAVLVSGGAISRGAHVRVTGSLDDRYAQRTIRADALDVVTLGTGDAPPANAVASGQIGEAFEGSLVRVTATVVDGPTMLSSGPAYDVDDGTGVARVLVATSTGIDTTTWSVGTSLDLVGVVGQRDSSGTGAAGYRLQPRDAADVVSVTPAPSPIPTPSPSPTSGATATPGGSAVPTPAPGTMSIAEARQASKNAAVRVRGVVTLPSGLVDESTVVVQDATGAIVLRLGDDAGALTRGRLVEVSGARSTKGGMETVRVTVPPSDLGAATEPAPRAVRTGDVGEALEAQLVLVRGAVSSPRHSSNGTVSFDVDDGTGPLRVVATSAVGVDAELNAGDWIEVVGVVGQETTGAQPLRGYRLWPRDPSDLRVTASAGDADGADGASGSNGGGRGGGGADRDATSRGGTVSLGSLDRPGAPHDLEIGATLVAARWPELGVAGLLWDGERLVAIDDQAAAAIARSVPRVTVPLPLRLTGLSGAGRHEATGIGIVTLGSGHVASGGALAAPVTQLPGAGEAPRWVTVVGRLIRGPTDDRATVMLAGRGPVTVVNACAARTPHAGDRGQVSVTGIGSASPAAITVGCDGIRTAPVLRAGPSLALRGPSDVAVLSTSTAPDASGSGADDSRLAAALVLLVGLFLVVAAAIARALRLGGEGPELSTTDADTTHDDDDEDATESEPAVRVPALTLVAVPRERGP